jgi:hypothetical protein
VLPALLPHAAVDSIALECGIRPINEVALALRADAWLHAHGDLGSPVAKSIKSMIRAAFHSDDLLWQGMALARVWRHAKPHWVEWRLSPLSSEGVIAESGLSSIRCDCKLVAYPELRCPYRSNTMNRTLGNDI